MTSSADEDLLYSLAAWITRRSEAAKQSVVEVLAQYITVAYDLGGQAAGAEVGVTTPIALDGLDAVIDKLGPVLDETFGNLSGDLTGVIERGIMDGRTFQEVRAQLVEKLDAGWGQSVTFTRQGQTRRYVGVNPDGSLEWRIKTISRNVTMDAETYANTLARTNIKAAWAEGHRQRYKESGRKGWVYLSVADERTRPTHLALHGKVFIFGTEEEAMALEVMKEPNCRCRMKAWFDDSDLDRSDDAYARERKTRAEHLLKDTPEGSDDARFLQQVIQQATA
ncbi:MAG: phage minor head protein [Methanofollis sp.]|uniref:phage minor head protein n=1 Tax=Methanofollis sp. TaxID=2052835 RepID=UPI002634EAD2|nr:phage minor head protein [Methanofollis sp.]MDD4255339.1 phage minor head protein [Methanofollis sp.]